MVKDRRAFGREYIERGQHCGIKGMKCRVAQGPGFVGNAGGVNSVPVIAVESATFRKEPGKRSGMAFWKRVFGSPLELDFGWRSPAMNSLAGEIEGLSFL